MICMAVVFVALILIFPNWFMTQGNHAVSFYYIWQGDVNYRQSHLQEAIDNYNIALKLYPEHVKGQYNLGNIYVAYEDYNSAVTCYEKALSVDPNYINARINLGIILSEQLTQADRAIIEYLKAVNSDGFAIKIPFIYDSDSSKKSDKAAAYYNLGLAYKAKSLLIGNKDSARQYLLKAAESYRESLKLNQNIYRTHFNLALTLQLLGNFTEAKEEYCKAINLEPLRYEAHYNLAVLLKQESKYTESIKELEKAGLILDTNGDADKTQYIYQILNEVSQRAIAKKETPNKAVTGNNDKPQTPDNNITYLNGKVIATESLEKAIIENMRTCSVCKK